MKSRCKRLISVGKSINIVLQFSTNIMSIWVRNRLNHLFSTSKLGIPN